MSRPVSTELPHSVSSSPAHSESSIDINDDSHDEDVSQSPKSAQLSSSIASKSLNKPAKLSFSISRLLGANSVAEKHEHNHGATSEGESESPSSLCSQCPSMDNNNTVTYSGLSPDGKGSSGHRMTMSPYELAMNHLAGTGASSVIRVPAHRPPPSMPYTAHYPWLGPTAPTLIKDGLQSK